MICSHCGSTLRQTARVCIQCGTAVPATNDTAAASLTATTQEVRAPATANPAVTMAPSIAVDAPPAPLYEAAPALHTGTVPGSALHTQTLFDMGDVSKAVVIELLVQEGDTVAAEQALMCVETEKFIIEVPSECAGEVRALLVKVGDPVRRDQALAQIWGLRNAPALAPAAPSFAEVPVGSTPSDMSVAKTKSSWGLWRVGAALGVGATLGAGGYLLVQALNLPSLFSSNGGSPARQSVNQIQAPPPISHSPAASTVAFNTDDINTLLRMAATDDWSGVQAVLRDKRPQTHLVQDKNTARSYNQAGLDLINQGDWGSAQSMFEQAVQANANDPEIRNNLGFAELRLGHHEQAQEHLVTTLLMTPGRANAWSNLAELMADTNEPATSAASLRLAVHFSRNQKRTLEILSDPARVTSPALRGVIESNWTAIFAVPPYNP
jgi:pyruvate/2-oxoglutarate dehydrogenase complex dihydrolipoamide acyltransferase (E2) component